MGCVADTFERLMAQAWGPDELVAMLPKVGDKLMKHAHILGVWPEVVEYGPFECTVTFVNREHLWYEVQFDEPNVKFKECYKLPDTKPLKLDRELFYSADKIAIMGRVPTKKRQNTMIKNH